MKQRLLLSLLLALALLYYAVPRLDLSLNGMSSYFSVAWLLFALLVVGGNFAGLLYTPKKAVQKNSRFTARKKRVGSRRRIRQRMN